MTSKNSTDSRRPSTEGLQPADISSHDLWPVPEYYALNSPPAPVTTAVEGDHSTDVLIIGAGYTGLSTAVHLGMRGIRSMVVESRSIGWGASSRNFGQVVPYLKHHPDKITAQFGPAVAERLIEDTGRGPDLVFGLIDQFGIECSAVRAGLLFALYSGGARSGLAARTKYWQERGAPIELLGSQDTQRLVGSAYYSASALDRRGGTLNPVAYVRGLAKAAMALGAQVFTNSPASDIRQTPEGWAVDTPGGTIKARQLVLATNGYTPRALWPGLKDSIIPMRAYQAISEPLPAALMKNILPQAQALTDTRNLFSGLRVYPDGRLQAGLDGPAFSGEGQPFLHRASERVLALFPELKAVRWQYHWSGWIAMTYDQTPHLHELAPSLWAGLGYSGRGIAHATMMGRDLASVLADGPAARVTFPVSPLKPRLSARFARPLVGSLLNYYRIVDRINGSTRS